jgi:hypothetical protein
VRLVRTKRRKCHSSHHVDTSAALNSCIMTWFPTRMMVSWFVWLQTLHILYIHAYGLGCCRLIRSPFHSITTPWRKRPPLRFSC